MFNALNIAFVSPNRHKYSETFIHNHLKNLDGNIFFLFDGYLPTKHSEDKGLTFSSFLKWKSLFTRLLQREQIIDKVKLNRKIKSYLLKYKIKIIFCEYGPSGVEMMEIAKDCSIPMIVHFHGYDAYRNDILSSYGNSYSQLFSSAEALIVVSKHMFKQLEILNCPTNKVNLVNYGIDLKLFQPTQNNNTQFDFIFCGRFVDKKGPKQIIQAFNILSKQFPDVNMCMIGDGYLLEDCKKLVYKLGLIENITFTGVLSPSEVALAFNNSKIFLLNSNRTEDNDSEGLPNSILEAGACGLSVISTYHAGIPELIVNRLNGILVHENDEDALVFAMRELLIDSELRLKLGKNLHLQVIKDFSIDRNKEQLMEIINKTLPSNS